MCSNTQPPFPGATTQWCLGRRRRRAGVRPGFSFIEIMVVVVIIGILAGAVALKAMAYIDTARVNRARSDIATIVSAVEAYYLTHSHYPGPDEGLEKLMLKNRLDPWGRTYQYNVPGREGEPFEVFTLGADNREGGEGVNADIYSWQLGEDALQLGEKEKE